MIGQSSVIAKDAGKVELEDIPTCVNEYVGDDECTSTRCSATHVSTPSTSTGKDAPEFNWERLLDLQMTMETDKGADIICPFKDLASWRHAVQSPLQAAQHCMGEAEDWELQEAIARTSDRAQELVEKAVKVIVAFAKTSRDANEKMLPLLQEARKKGKKIRAANNVSFAQGVFVDLRKQASDARSGYLDLLEQVRYMMRCNVLSMDYCFLKIQEAHTHNQLESEPPVSMQATSLQELQDMTRKIVDLHQANLHLEVSLKVLEGCSVFWLLIHSSELKLESMKSMAHILRTELSQGRDWPARLTDFCLAVGQFCDQYKPLYLRPEV